MKDTSSFQLCAWVPRLLDHLHDLAADILLHSLPHSAQICGISGIVRNCHESDTMALRKHGGAQTLLGLLKRCYTVRAGTEGRPARRRA